MMRSMFGRVTKPNRLLGKSFDAIPVVATEDLPANLEAMNAMIDYWRGWEKKYGLIFKAPSYLKPGDEPTVYVSEAKDIGTAYRAEGKYPNRGDGFSAFNEYFVRGGQEWRTKDGELKTFFFNINGEHGMRIRQSIQQNLMSPAALAKVGERFLGDVAADFKQKLDTMTDNPQHRLEGTDLTRLTFRFAFEAAGTAMFGRRLGLLGTNPNPDAQEWIDNMRPLILAGVEMMFSGDQSWDDHKSTTPEYLEYHRLMHTSLAAGERLLKESKQHLSDDVPSVLHDVIEALDKGKLEDIQEANLAMYQVMGAAVDTTANTLLWNLNHLATQPEVQQKAREEVLRVFPDSINFADSSKLEYLRCVMHETFRLTPTVFFGLRKTAKDVELAGYDVPAGTYVQMNQAAAQVNEKMFKEPLAYKPERWAKMAKEEATEAHVLENNFGRGPRMCVGVRLARAELLLSLSTILKHYDILPAEDYVTPKPKYFLVNSPDPAPTLRFIPRRLSN
eukprot:TRINITY_DN68064_c5_g7_i1.p1 TRINITY_DN68064_c5_g7~~TRINITY_DN68064_c5_g7_i1.p1  ORF type:complete len:523 (+),score=78.30 TRINITY_DN68064_c5_g7_i1:61-1569(+)